MDLIEPRSRDELLAVLAAASAEHRTLLPVGGGTHLAKGNPTEVDAHLSLRRFDRIVELDPAEQMAMVEAGLSCAALDVALAEHGLEWPVDAPPGATVGGVIASATSSPRRLRTGPVRDLVLGVSLATGDGRWIRGGGRTVKNVSGFDLTRLLVGSLGTLGILVEVVLRLLPRPRARRTIVASGGLHAAARVLSTVPRPTAVLVAPELVELRLEGWPEDVEAQSALAASVLDAPHIADEAPFPATELCAPAPVVVEAAVPGSRLGDLAEAAGGCWAGLMGVGVLWVGLPDAGASLTDLRARALTLGGIAPVVRGPGGLGSSPGFADQLVLQGRIKAALDPGGILAPGRFWGEARATDERNER